MDFWFFETTSPWESRGTPPTPPPQEVRFLTTMIPSWGLIPGRGSIEGGTLGFPRHQISLEVVTSNEDQLAQAVRDGTLKGLGLLARDDLARPGQI